MKDDFLKCNYIESDNLYNEECPIMHTMEIIGQKWKLPIIWNCR